MVDKLRLQFSLGSPGLTDKEKGGYFRVEGDDPNESTMKAAVSYISPQIPSSSTLAHLGFDLRPSDLFFLIYFRDEDLIRPIHIESLPYTTSNGYFPRFTSFL